MTTTTAGTFTEWAGHVPGASHRAVLPFGGDPLHAAAHLAASVPGEPHVVYERDGTWHVALGAAAELRAGAATVTAEAAGRTWTGPVDGQPLRAVADALRDLARAQPGGRRAYGWAAFELAHLLHGVPERRPVPDEVLHLLVPAVEVALRFGDAVITAGNPQSLHRTADLLGAVPQEASCAPVRPDVDLTAADPYGYRKAVAAVVAEIAAGRLEKAVLSRPVRLASDSVDLPATYLAGRLANTPARSFLLDLGGWQAAGFSPETVLESAPGGRIATQPLAGTRAFGSDPAENARLRAELLADPKEVHEHAVSVRSAGEELADVCEPGSVVVEDFMSVKERGSVQHLASRVAGTLRDGLDAWDAFGALFPAVTATGVPKRAALAALARHESQPRGLYGGAVLMADTEGGLDAALVLRTVFRRGGRTWLRAGAGVMGASTPEREFEETCEKLRSVAPHLRRA